MDAFSTIVQVNDECVYISYPLFKQYVQQPALFEPFVLFLENVFLQVVQQYRGFYCCIDLKGFSVTAAHRYKDVMRIFSFETCARNPQFPEWLQEMRLVNTPSCIQTIMQIFKPFMNAMIVSKIKYV
jgi:hypothetical protein